MNTTPNNPAGRGNRRRKLAIVAVLILVISGASVFFVTRGPRGPKLLNQETKAREARPFSTKPDPRFAPLPIEREKHGK